MVAHGDSDLVVRPPEVWDTRAPFSYFLSHHRQHNQAYYSLYLAVEKLRNDLAKADPSGRARDVLGLEVPDSQATRAFGRLRSSFPADKSGNRASPRIADIARFLEAGISALTQHAITDYCCSFEQFLHCWSLNYLLARLECVGSLTSDERRLARAFHPGRQRHALPSLSDIVTAIPELVRELTIAPHVMTNYRTGDVVLEPVSPILNAYTAVRFWRDWRNLLVHGPGIVTDRFVIAHGVFWSEFRLMYSAMPDLCVGQALHLDQETFRPFATVHYKAARHLRDVLVRVSEGRRGHCLAPNSPIDPLPPELVPPVPPPFLLPGDHEASLAAA
jgi:hypothetical protein